MFNRIARDAFAYVEGINTEHMKLAWVKEWRASDWMDIPDIDRKTISQKVRKFRNNVKKLGNNQRENEKLAQESIGILRAINKILLNNKIYS